MKSLIYFLPIIFTSIIGAQTHFTIPQNVWRVSLKTDHSSGKWKGNSLSDGQKYRYKVDTLNFEVSQFFKRSTVQSQAKFEYGFTDKVTLLLEIPYVTNLSESRSWKIANDSLAMGLDSLLNFYYPEPINLSLIHI